MTWWHRLWSGRQLERELDAELHYHFERLVDDNVRAGMSQEDARRHARLHFGGDDQLKEGCRDVRGTRWLHDAVLDVRFAARLLVKEPWFTLAAVVALALGMGVTAMMTTIINGYYFRGLPGDDADRILYVSTREPSGRDRGLSYAEFDDVREATRTFAGLAAFSGGLMTISDPGRSPDKVPGRYISARAFRLLDVSPALGRDFREEDDRPGAVAVVMLGHRLWTTRYDADPAIIGRIVRVNNVPCSVIGVMPEGFEFPFRDVVWQPLALMPDLRGQARDARTLDVVGRLADGVSARQGRAELGAIAARLALQHPATNTGVEVTAVRFGEGQMGEFRTAIVPQMLLATGVFVLLIACANVANLLLARSAGRAREIAIRASVGATRWRIVRQLLVESLLLAFAAGTLGLGLSTFGVAFVSQAFGDNVPYWMQFTIDRRVLTLLATVCVLTTVLFGLAPALYVSKADVNGVMKEGGRVGIAPRVQRWTSALLVAEVALTLTLLSGAGLMMRSFLVLYRSDRLVELTDLLTLRLALPEAKYPTPEMRAAFYERLDQRLEAVPSVSSASIASALPFLGAPGRLLSIRGRLESDGNDRPSVSSVAIGRRYFETLNLRLLRGQVFTPVDGSPGREVAIVNQRFVEKYFPNEEPLGQQVRLIVPRSGDTSAPWLTIVGVSPTIRQSVARVAQPVVYVPRRREPGPGAMFLVRTRGDAGGIVSTLRRDVAALDADVPLFNTQTLQRVRDNTRLQPRLIGTLLAAFAGIALVLSALGLYSVTAYAVRQRTQEIGVRMALGAQPGQVVWLFVRRAGVRLGAGLGLGLAGAVAVGQLLRGALIETSATDPLTLVSIVMLLVTVAMAACFIPARRAARLDPVRALRYE